MNPQNAESTRDWYVAVPERRAGDRAEFVAVMQDGIRLESRDGLRRRHGSLEALSDLPVPDLPGGPPDLVQAMIIRSTEYGRTTSTLGRPLTPAERDISLDHVAKALVVHRSPRWREAVSTALLGDWCDPLWKTGYLPATAIGALRAEARTLHRQLVPVSQRGSRRGRVLSLDADLGGLSLYDLVAADVDLLAFTAGGVFEDKGLNSVLRALTPAERRVVFAYAEGEGTTWTEAAATTGAAGPEAFGERVRRKAKRLAAEQARRAGQSHPGPASD
ncbi:hypothetical protein [Streptomyces sp. NBC_00989]|uniref:hypothetical protein n=1 Tax=Streptomyces sp. NBC_00989 TaxID=2903705 RepID=UPI002F90DC0A|nr:hypothetical protein OG714_54360 [Streptomyces sp. NBC_00989]